MVQEQHELDHANVPVLPPVVLLTAIVAGVVLKWLMGGSITSASGLRLGLGGLLLAAGLGLEAWFARAFKAAGQDPNPNTPTPGITDAGPFRYTRNPAYVGILALQVGLAFLVNNAWMLALAIPVFLYLNVAVIPREERYLERKFGQAYVQYKAEVRRWL